MAKQKLHKTDYDNQADLYHFIDEHKKAEEMIKECKEFYKSFLSSKLHPLSYYLKMPGIEEILSRDFTCDVTVSRTSYKLRMKDIFPNYAFADKKLFEFVSKVMTISEYDGRKEKNIPFDKESVVDFQFASLFNISGIVAVYRAQQEINSNNVCEFEIEYRVEPLTYLSSYHCDRHDRIYVKHVYHKDFPYLDLAHTSLDCRSLRMGEKKRMEFISKYNKFRDYAEGVLHKHITDIFFDCLYTIPFEVNTHRVLVHSTLIDGKHGKGDVVCLSRGYNSNRSSCECEFDIRKYVSKEDMMKMYDTSYSSSSIVSYFCRDCMCNMSGFGMTTYKSIAQSLYVDKIPSILNCIGDKNNDLLYMYYNGRIKYVCKTRDIGSFKISTTTVEQVDKNFEHLIPKDNIRKDKRSCWDERVVRLKEPILCLQCDLSIREQIDRDMFSGTVKYMETFGKILFDVNTNEPINFEQHSFIQEEKTKW